MEEEVAARLGRWREAGLIDPATAERIRAWEARQPRQPRVRPDVWPGRLLLGFGALALGAGLLLFVSAHWPSLSPGTRYGLLVLLVGGLHLAGTAAARLPALATSLHALGTIALGAGLYLCGRLFHLPPHWPAGLLLWSAGAGIGWGLLRQWPQLALLALLLPAWLCSLWLEALAPGAAAVGSAAELVPTTGLLLLALVYLAGPAPGRPGAADRTLLWIGGVALLPAGLLWQLAWLQNPGGAAPPAFPPPLALLGWATALVAPLTLALLRRRRRAWPLAVAAGWMMLPRLLPLDPAGVAAHLWWALGAALLAGWGVAERRPERINLGSALLALTLLAFYFSNVLDRLGRAAGLVVLGLLLLLGGALLEAGRRRLVAGTRRAQQ